MDSRPQRNQLYEHPSTILPWVRVPHLASHILGRVARRISSDWIEKYGHPIYLLETFVERDCFPGTCYRAASWTYVGQTRGRSRNGHPGLKVPVKDIYLYPLTKRFRDILSQRAGGEASVRAIGGYMRHLGLTYRKAARFLKHVFDIDLTHPSLFSFNTEQAQNGAPLYEGIKQSIRHSPSVNADETGWRLDGDNHWLWVFTSKDAVLYHIDERRGGKVVRDILGEKYQGVLGCDFLSAYSGSSSPKVVLQTQVCIWPYPLV